MSNQFTVNKRLFEIIQKIEKYFTFSSAKIHFGESKLLLDPFPQSIVAFSY